MFEVKRAVITELKQRFIVTSASHLSHLDSTSKHLQLRKLTNAPCFRNKWNISQTLGFLSKTLCHGKRDLCYFENIQFPFKYISYPFLRDMKAKQGSSSYSLLNTYFS